MIVLDTNVLSELMRARPDPRVVAWLDAQEPARLSVTAITAAELLYGVARLPVGSRRSRLSTMVGEMLEIDFAGRVLPFDAAAAVEYARICAGRERRGRPVGSADAQIGAIATACGASALATRNTKDFDQMGLDLVDPWTAPPEPAAPRL